VDTVLYVNAPGARPPKRRCSSRPLYSSRPSLGSKQIEVEDPLALLDSRRGARTGHRHPRARRTQGRL